MKSTNRMGHIGTNIGQKMPNRDFREKQPPKTASAIFPGNGFGFIVQCFGTGFRNRFASVMEAVQFFRPHGEQNGRHDRRRLAFHIAQWNRQKKNTSDTTIQVAQTPTCTNTQFSRQKKRNSPTMTHNAPCMEKPAAITT